MANYLVVLYGDWIVFLFLAYLVTSWISCPGVPIRTFYLVA